MTRAPLDSPGLQSKALLAVVLLVTALFVLVMWPLWGAASWAIFIAIVFASLQDRAVQACRGRRGWAAFGTLLVILVSVILPMALLGVAVTHEAGAFYDRIRSGDIQVGQWFQSAMEGLPGWARTALSRVGIDDLPALQRKTVATLQGSG